jgi:hypothetical protein
MIRTIKSALALTLSISVLSACSAVTTLHSTQPAGSLAVREKSYSSFPSSDTFSTTSFGNYEFKATRKDGDPFYGILPLKFNGGYLALDILFFAPATFFNLREVYRLYEIDADKGVVRYRQDDKQGWTEYKPSHEEAERAKRYFSAAK